MEKRDFEWCFEHESFFREWWFHINEIIPNSNLWLDDDSFFDCWKMAKQYAYKIANSADPLIRYIYTYSEIHKNTPVYVNHLFCFLWTMLMSIKNENLEKMVSSFKNCLELDEYSPDSKLLQASLKLVLKMGEKENNYDYSLPDGGIKDETITQTITKAETAENNETLLERLKPIFYGDEKRAEVYIKEFKNSNNDVEKVRYTAQLVNENTISEMSCHRDLYSILHDHRLYTKTESNWNKVINQYLVKK